MVLVETSGDLVVMYRPAGPAEMALVEESGFRRWPPRLPDQPIFYPVTNEEYARGVNRWNVKDWGIGYITRFTVKKSFADRYEIHCVGGAGDDEWWIPAEDLEELNDNIVGPIEVLAVEQQKDSR